MPKSAQVSGFDVAARNYKALVNEVVNLGGGDDDMNRLHTDRDLRRRIAELLVAQPTGDGLPSIIVREVLQHYAELLVAHPKVDVWPRTVFPLTIDYAQSLANMVTDGRYDFIVPGVTEENFPVGSGDESVEAVLVHLGRNASDEEVLAEMELQGLRPATMVELLAFGTRYPEIQREFPIGAFGSVWVDPKGFRIVGCLWGLNGYRRLIVRSLDGYWHADYRFLAIRK